MINITTDTLTEKVVKYVMLFSCGQLSIDERKHVAKQAGFGVKKMIEEAFFGHAYMAYFDGSATPNPGDMKIGGYIRGPGTKKERICEYSQSIGYGTNNEAEYLSLIHLLHAIKNHGIWKVRIHGDSSLVVNQVNGDSRARDARMKAFRNEAIDLLKNVNQWTLLHIPRSQNKGADSLT